MPIITRRATQLIASMDESVATAEQQRDKLCEQAREAQYRFECLSDARTRVAAILAELDKPEEPPF